MTQRVLTPLTVEEEEILGQFRKVLQEAKLTRAEARRINEQIGRFLRPHNLAQETFSRFIDKCRQPYVSTATRAVPAHLRGRLSLTIRRTDDVLERWYLPEEDEFDRLLKAEVREGEEVAEFKVISVQYHLESREIFRRILSQRALRLANFWELAACAEYASRLGRLTKTRLRGGSNLVLGGTRFRSRPVVVHQDTRWDMLGGNYLVAVEKK